MIPKDAVLCCWTTGGPFNHGTPRMCAYTDNAHRIVGRYIAANRDGGGWELFDNFTPAVVVAGVFDTEEEACAVLTAMAAMT